VRRAVAGIGMGLEREEDLSRTAWTEVEREGWEERSRSRVDIGGGRGALVISVLRSSFYLAFKHSG